MSQSGSTTNLPPSDPNPNGKSTPDWELEEALDVEWAHALAPGAKIIAVGEAEQRRTLSDLLPAAVTTAANSSQLRVSVVSMSWG